MTRARLNQLVEGANLGMQPMIARESGIESRYVGGRRVARLTRRAPIFAKLSGSSSPYSFTEQVETSPGTWANGPTTGSANAYEVNGKASLNNKVVRLYPDPFGKWRFQWMAKDAAPSGGGGTCSTGSFPVLILGCKEIPLPGATVTIIGPGLAIGTGTTNSSGMITFSMTGKPTGIYSITVTHSRFQTTVAFALVDCGANSTVVVQLLPATGYQCLLCDGPLPIKETLHASPPWGPSFTMTYQSTGFYAGSWIGTSPLTLEAYTSVPCHPGISAISTITSNMLWVFTKGCGAQVRFSTCECYSTVGYAIVSDDAFPTAFQNCTIPEVGFKSPDAAVNSPFSMTFNGWTLLDAALNEFTGSLVITE